MVNIKHGVLYITILVTSPISLYCLALNNNNKKKGDGMVTQMFYYEMPNEQEMQFKHNLNTIHIGDTLKNIVGILGKPDFDQVTLRKAPVEKESNDSSLFRALEYYVKRWRKNLVNEKHDKLVTLYFNVNNILYKVSSNVDSIPSRE